MQHNFRMCACIYSICILIYVCYVFQLFIYDSIGNISLGVNIVLLLGTHSSLGENSKALATVTAIIDGTGSIGAAIGPLLAGLVSRWGWHNVFYMLMCADLFALLVSPLCLFIDINKIITNNAHILLRCFSFCPD